MTIKILRSKLAWRLFLCAFCLSAAPFGGAQEVVRTIGSAYDLSVDPGSVLVEDSPLLSIVRATAPEVDSPLVQNVLNYNLSVGMAPVVGLNLRADAWRQQVEGGPAITLTGDNWRNQPTNPYKDDHGVGALSPVNPLLGNQLESNGFDLGASFAWGTDRFGQFTLSSRTTYVQQFENNGTLLELANSDLADADERVVSPELQSSLMLTWQFGNHTASAITNYFDSFKDLSELDLEQLNQLVDSISTIDLQYGYSVRTGLKDRAIISFGVRNIFNEKTAQILNSTTRILDQNGRVAYGSIKYQF